MLAGGSGMLRKVHMIYEPVVCGGLRSRMKKLMRTGLIGFFAVASLRAEVVTFDSSDGYTEGQVLASGTALLPDAGFVYKQTGGAATSSNVIQNQSLKIYGGSATTFTTAWVRDAAPTVYNDVSGRWIRSVDVTLGAETAKGTAGPIGVCLGNGAVFNADKIDLSAKYALRVNLMASSTAGNGVLMINRYADVAGTDTSQGYNFTTGQWTGNTYYIYDVTHTVNVGYIYDSAAGLFSVVIRDVTAGTELIKLTMESSQMASFVGGTNTMMFAAGDMWQNLSQGAVAFLDNFSTVPEPPEGSMLLFGAGMIFVSCRHLIRN